MSFGFPVTARWRPAHGSNKISLRGCQPKFQTYLALHKCTLLSKANESAEGVSGLILCLPWPSVVCQHRHCGMHVCSWFSGFCWGVLPSSPLILLLSSRISP